MTKTLNEYRNIAIGGRKLRAIYNALTDGLVLTAKTANFIGCTTEGTRYLRMIREDKYGTLIADGWEFHDQWNTCKGEHYKSYWLTKIKANENR